MSKPRFAVVKDPRFKDHKTPVSHPESPDRVSAINHLLESIATKFGEVQIREASEDEIASTHSPTYIEELSKMAEIAIERDSLIGIDPDTVMSPRSYQTAKLAVGAALNAVDAVAKEEFDSCFVAVRPPGHHALKDQAMGFCLFNNVAIAANYAKEKAGFKRVFILDWDVHHGNGTQDIFYHDPQVMFTSMHQHPFWPPGSGRLDETGHKDGSGFNINIPLPAGTGDIGYLKTMDSLVMPVCREYNPDLIIVSAGYDAHRDDPIASQNLTTVGFSMLSQRVADLRDQCNAKVVCLLEGGYNTEALAESVLSTMQVLNASSAEELGELHASQIVSKTIFGNDPITEDEDGNAVEEQIENVKRSQSEFWQCFK